MKRAPFNDEQLTGVLREVEAKVVEICREHGISEAAFYEWRSKQDGEELADPKRLKQLDEENQRLRSIVADLTLRNQALKGVVSKKW